MGLGVFVFEAAFSIANQAADEASDDRGLFKELKGVFRCEGVHGLAGFDLCDEFME